MKEETTQDFDWIGWVSKISHQELKDGYDWMGTIVGEISIMLDEIEKLEKSRTISRPLQMGVVSPEDKLLAQIEKRFISLLEQSMYYLPEGK